MNKRLIAIILAVGALVAIGLGLVFSFKTRELKGQLESSLNDNFKKIASSLEADGLKVSYEPFKCGGILGVECYSKEIRLQEEGDDLAQFVAHNVGLELATNSISTNAIKATLKVKNFEITSLDSTNKEFAQELESIESFIPKNLVCDVDFIHEKNTLSESTSCHISAPNAEYEGKVSGIYADESFNDKNIAQILQEFYFKLLATPEDHIDSFDKTYPRLQYALNEFSFSAKDKGFSKDFYALYQKQAQSNGITATKESFEQSVRAAMVGFTIGTRLIFGNTYQNDFAVLSDSITYYVLGQSGEVGFRFSQKDMANPHFISIDEFSQSPNISHIFDSLQLEVHSK